MGGLMMATPYDNKTIDEIKTLIVDGLQQQWNKKLRILPKSFIKTFAAVLAAVYIILFKQIGWLFLQIFPETAYWGEITVLGIRVRPLVKWGVLLGVGEPRRGSQWQGKIQINVTKKNTFLDTGTQLKSDTTGKIYLIDETIALENDTELTAVMCSSLGTAGNLEEGETLCFVSPLGNVKKEAIVTEVIKKAINDETQADYRYRVVNRWRVQPQGGSLSDYRIWGLDVPGVLNIYPYNDDNSPAGVLIYVSGNPAIYPDRIPSSELLIAVGKSCTYNPETGKADRKPITAIIDPEKNERYTNVKPVTIKTFDVYIERLSGITAPEFSEYVKTPIGEYFLGRESYIRGLSDDNNKTSLVSRNNVLSVVDQVAMPLKAEFENVIMKQGDTIISTYTLGMGELCALNNLYINGEVF
jgi:uncharacterized phage protein gp47/JayE